MLQIVKKHKKKIGVILFITYLVYVVWATVLNRYKYPERVIRLELFWAFRDYLSGSEKGYIESVQYIKNVIFFIPFGFLIPWKKSISQVLWMAICSSAFVETMQFLFMIGECELDDVISNTFGAFIGFLLYRAIENIIKNRRKKLCLKEE